MSVDLQQPSISELLKDIGSGRIQLPDFQREYRWDVERIRELLVTVLRGHPMGVIMVLQTGSDQVRFKPKALTGVLRGGENCKFCADRYQDAPKLAVATPDYLLLDGQQRLTSLYQALSGDGVVHSADDKGKIRHVKYFIDIEKAMGDAAEQDEAIVVLPHDGIERTNFGREIVRDCSTQAGQVAEGLLPITAMFADGKDSFTNWMIEYIRQGDSDSERRMNLFSSLQNKVFGRLTSYQVPGIELLKDTSREAVATVFEKVNTGGLALDTFELLTATFAGDPLGQSVDGADFRLVDDYAKTQSVLDKHPSLGGFQRVAFLQAITLLATHARREGDLADGRPKPRPTSARRDDILRLELKDYLQWADRVRAALPWVAHFYTEQHIHSERFVPYATQSVPLVVIRVLLGEDADKYAAKQRLAQWFWSGVLGELYGSTTETRFARDVDQVVPWVRAALGQADARPPETVTAASFAETRLLTLRTRLSAAYKGIYALLMRGGCKDWLFDKDIDHATYFDLQVDIHHVFPKKWCDDNGIDDIQRESIVNKTPLAKKTNLLIGAKSPVTYVPEIASSAGLSDEAFDRLLQSHAIHPATMRAGDFDAFFESRKEAIVNLVEAAMGKAVLRDLATTDPDELDFENEEPELTDAE